MPLKYGEIGNYDPSQNWRPIKRLPTLPRCKRCLGGKRQQVMLFSTMGRPSYQVVDNLKAPTTLTNDTVTFETLVKQLCFIDKKNNR